ncbi:hypothetical protein [Streptomyces prasinus]|uniref:Uncharacterized protein n=1 Tax=Streptomyces prasinus TaxID=67345 RepID=A0ABX6ASE5_9ACTN|nr:hypothetical protein [Streptomyces prasinus]QEV04950.1 hypothetical protein CP972_03905 [Streptomyces prasinus]
MALHARAFFMEHLKLPSVDAAVVGNTYFATPAPGSPLRLRIDFARTIRADEYDGLRLATIHQDRGELDVVVLRFEDHNTFDHRDAARGRSPQESGYGTFYEFRDRPDWVPWEGAHTHVLRDAIEQYASVWFPGAREAPAPSRASARTARKAPASPATHSGSCSR